MSFFKPARFLTTSVNKSQFPEQMLPEIVLAGRSNVGKSSLINGLTGHKSLAYVGKTPGKTRYLNFYEIGERFCLVDVPGYGYAKRSDAELKRYGVLMEDYFSTRNVSAVFLVVDSRHPLFTDDEDMLSFIREQNYPHAIIATKMDKLSYSQQLNTKNKLKEQYYCPVFMVSSSKHQGFEAIDDWCREQFNF